MDEIEKLRREIDAIDARLIELLAERKRTVEQIAFSKKSLDMTARQPDRWNEVLERCRQQARSGKLDPELIESIWNQLHSYFLEVEQQILND